MKLRERLYALGIFKSNQLSIPVISVGNLVLGGTGKTPMVHYLVTLLRQTGLQPAIISRGYKGEAKAAVNVVSDGRSVLLSAKEAGDEPYMLASTLPGTPVFTGKKRIQPARAAQERGADCLILDDGFQHLAVARDLNIVLFDATYHAGNSRIFPGGPLREPISALARASCFIMTGTTEKNEERAKKFSDLLVQKFPEKPVFFARRSPLYFVDKNGVHCDAAKLGPCLAFCGIALPDRFAQSLKETTIDLRSFITRPDHAAYTDTEQQRLEKQAEKCGAKALITTEKDVVKLQTSAFSLPLYIAKFELTISDDFAIFVEEHIAQ